VPSDAGSIPAASTKKKAEFPPDNGAQALILSVFILPLLQNKRHMWKMY